MDKVWFTNISWYGVLLEFLAAFIGILQYVGAERIERIATTFDVRNSASFERMGRWGIPVEGNLASWLRAQKHLMQTLLKNQRFAFPFFFLSLLAGVVTLTYDLGTRTDILRVFGQIVTVIIIISVLGLFLPLVLYVAILILVALYLLVTILPQMFIHYSLSFVSLLLKLTASSRQRLIYISIAVAVLGLFLQVIGPMFDLGVLVDRMHGLLR